jgi:hypothetical protein
MSFGVSACLHDVIIGTPLTVDESSNLRSQGDQRNAALFSQAADLRDRPLQTRPQNLFEVVSHG